MVERSSASRPSGPIAPDPRTCPWAAHPASPCTMPTLAAAPFSGVGANQSTSADGDDCHIGA